MAAAGVDFGCSRGHCGHSASTARTERGRIIYRTPLGSTDVLACPAAVLRALCRLCRGPDLRPDLVAVFSLQRALWIAVASGLRYGDGYRRASGSADRRVELEAANGVRARRVRVGDSQLRFDLALYAGFIERSSSQHGHAEPTRS